MNVHSVASRRAGARRPEWGAHRAVLPLYHVRKYRGRGPAAAVPAQTLLERPDTSVAARTTGVSVLWGGTV
jgi:hypothetical protein